jgi:hypothetical protein
VIFFLFITLETTILNAIFSMWSFRGYENDLGKKPHGVLAHTVPRRVNESEKNRLLRQTIKNKVTILGALFIFAYQGAEVSISGCVT